MGNFQILPEMGCKTTEEPLQTASWAEVAAPMTNDAVKQTANMSVRVGDADSSASNQKLKVERYTITVSNPRYAEDFDDGDRDEVRYRIVAEDGNVIDDAQGYGYRSAMKAQKAMWYKFKGGKQKMKHDERTRQWLFKSNPGFTKGYHRLREESNFLYAKYMGIDYSFEDWHRDLKELMNKFKIDLKYFNLLV